MSENDGSIKIIVGSDRSFGVVFAILFLLVGLFPLFKGGEPRFWVLAIALAFLIFAFVYPKALSVPNRLCFRFGIILGAFINPVIMALIYFVVVTPVGLVMKLLGKDILRQRIDAQVSTYWIKRDLPVGSMKNQF